MARGKLVIPRVDSGLCRMRIPGGNGQPEYAGQECHCPRPDACELGVPNALERAQHQRRQLRARRGNVIAASLYSAAAVVSAIIGSSFFFAGGWGIAFAVAFLALMVFQILAAVEYWRRR